jgi:hypothetical protein
MDEDPVFHQGIYCSNFVSLRILCQVFLLHWLNLQPGGMDGLRICIRMDGDCGYFGWIFLSLLRDIA